MNIFNSTGTNYWNYAWFRPLPWGFGWPFPCGNWKTGANLDEAGVQRTKRRDGRGPFGENDLPRASEGKDCISGHFALWRTHKAGSSSCILLACVANIRRAAFFCSETVFIGSEITAERRHSKCYAVFACELECMRWDFDVWCAKLHCFLLFWINGIST